MTMIGEPHAPNAAQPNSAKHAVFHSHMSTTCTRFQISSELLLIIESAPTSEDFGAYTDKKCCKPTFATYNNS